MWKKYSKIHKIAEKKDILKVGLLSAPKIHLMIKVTFFQKNHRSYVEENGGNWCKLNFRALFSEIWELCITTNFTSSCTESLDGVVVIIFRSNFYWFWKFWGDVGSNPSSWSWFFFLHFCMYVYHMLINRSQYFWVI